MQELMTRTTLELQLNVSKPTIIRWEKLGMPVIRIGGIVRYDIDEVKEWMRLRQFVKEVKKATKDIPYE